MMKACAMCAAFHVERGECRRKSPTLVPVPAQDLAGQQGIRGVGVYPSTQASGWCCEFLEKGLEVLQ
jgi:hypothetical protein